MPKEKKRSPHRRAYQSFEEHARKHRDEKVTWGEAWEKFKGWLAERDEAACAHCGTTFKPERTGRPQKYCSDVCRATDHRAKQSQGQGGS